MIEALPKKFTGGSFLRVMIEAKPLKAKFLKNHSHLT